MFVIVNAVKRRRQWINTKDAIANLEKRQRPVKSKYLKDGYELNSPAVGDDKMVSTNGHKHISKQDCDFGGVESKTMDQASHLTCQDGGCSKNSTQALHNI